MDVELYVYDLSRGLARQFSLQFIGTQIDAVYHTSIVLGGIEYFFGQGIHRKIPGSTHHGAPMEIVKMGRTSLPMDVIEDYIGGLAEIYTPESYDLFLHNCNNFSQDLSMFLVGRDIPKHISSLPQRFLETPIGQMLRGQIDQSMRQMTQAPDADNVPIRRMTTGTTPYQNGHNLQNGSASKDSNLTSTSTSDNVEAGRVQNITTLRELDTLLNAARSSCAVIFFTSATCPPCKIVYPAYDELALEARQKATLIKVDLSKAYEVGARYQVRATPTFVTFLRGGKENEWTGANEAQLRGNVRLLLSMAYPLHPHKQLRLPFLERKIPTPITYSKVPPLEKLTAKIPSLATDPAMITILSHIRSRESGGRADSPLPNLHTFSQLLSSQSKSLLPETAFAAIDLVRILCIDSRASSFFAAELAGHKMLLSLIPADTDYGSPSVPYSTQVTTLQLACNLFTSSVFSDALLPTANDTSLRNSILNLATTALLAQKPTARFLAAALVHNLALRDHNGRASDPTQPDQMHLDEAEELVASLTQAVVDEEESKENLHIMLLDLGLMLYGAEQQKEGQGESMAWELCEALGMEDAIKAKLKQEVFKDEPLIKEIGELLAKGKARAS